MVYTNPIRMSESLSSQLPNQDLIKDLENIRYALDQSSIVAITDNKGVIEYVNDKFVEISKYSREELIGKTHRVINSKHHPKEFIKNLWDTILSGQIWRGELRNRAKDGTYYWVDTTITPLLDKHGKIQKFISIRNDITKRKELEQQKDEFIAVASHELKTPITSLSLYLQLLNKQLKPAENKSLLPMVEKMQKQLNKLSSLVSDLLDVTKIEAGQIQFNFQTFTLSDLIAETIDEVQSVSPHHQIQFQNSVSATVKGDRERIGQVLTNLLINAVKYSPAANQVEVQLLKNHESITVGVKDFGIGIEPSDRDNIFTRFYRTKNNHSKSIPGIGLGLYISSEIIKRHQGKIWVDSHPGQGSIFYFSLPVDNK